MPVDLTDQLLAPIQQRWQSGERHAALVTGNTGDDWALGEHEGRLAEVLAAHFSERFDLVLRYDLADGLWVVHGAEHIRDREAASCLPLLNALPNDALRVARELLAGESELRAALVIDGLDDIAPLTSNAPSTVDRACLQQLERLGDDSRIADSEHLVIAICADASPALGRLAQPSSRWLRIELPPPDEDSRLAVVEDVLAGEQPPVLDGIEPQAIARLTRGMSSAELSHELRSRAVVDAREIHRMRSWAIHRSAEGLLDAITPREGGFAALPGTEHMQHSFEEMIAPDGSLVDPSGDAVTLAGPPGGGKTVFMHALAFERPVICLSLGDVRGMWYGQSERNITSVLRALRTYAPCVCFIDEIDGMLGQRPEGPDGTGGVDKRVFARFLAGIEETRANGEVLWVGATNRPDLIDEAMKSRFPRVLPVLLPGPRARGAILAAVARSLGVDDSEVDWTVVAGQLPNAASRDLEHVVRRAALRASGPLTPDAVRSVVDSWRPPESIDQIHAWSLAALEHVRFSLDMPPLDDLPEHLVGALT